MRGWIKKAWGRVDGSQPSSANSKDGKPSGSISAKDSLQHTVLFRNPEVIAQRANTETMLFCMETGQYYSLNDLGTRVWEMSDGTRRPDEIAAILEKEYDAAYAIILEDILALAVELTSDGLLIQPNHGSCPE